ncbi:interferon regulatory factor 3-like [Dendropsophus ebraccatus]|uniref:interferon regulatory factor 3-like n=1 Tax=Dendropsophus ebraccatus TaxID=150705 RepID=UPI003831021F
MSSSKPRIIPWLIRQIDGKIYPGLEWMNHEHTRFRVPWKHGLRQDSSLDDFKIFEAWAIASGCYDPLTEKPDPARWKRNFRSALIRKDGIHMILDRSSDAANPHKIYEITIPAQGAIHAEQYNSTTSNPDLHPNSSNNQDLHKTSRDLFEELENLDLYQEGEGNYDLLLIPLYILHLLFTGSSGVLNRLWYKIVDLHKAGMGYRTIGEQLGEKAISGSMQDLASLAKDDAEKEFYPHTINDFFFIGQVGPQPAEDQESFQQKILQHFSYNSFQTDFEVKIYYRGKLVQTTMVTNPHGFYITAEQRGRDDNLARVFLPQPASVVSDQLLIEAVNSLLTSLKQGTLVEVREGVICARRFGSCRSYWSMSNAPNTKIPNQIDKTEYTILYSIQQFITELIDFIEQRRKNSPEYSIWICLGKEWPDDKPWEKKYIMVQVTPVTMRLLHELSYSTGASSLTNSDIKLEISDSLSSTNNLLTLLRSIEDMMDWE